MLVSHALKNKHTFRFQDGGEDCFLNKFLKHDDCIKNAKIFYIDYNQPGVDDSIQAIRNNAVVCNELFKLPYPQILVESNSHEQLGACLLTQYKNIITATNFGFGPGGNVYPSKFIGTFQLGQFFQAEKNLVGIHGAKALNPVSGLEEVPDYDEFCDYMGYVGECVAAICLINSPKIIDTITKPTQHFLNKKRIRNGKPPITEYHVIKLKPEIERQFKESERNAASGKMPFHWRRGHFKALPCGLRWWNAHTVGKKENGEIISGYLLETA